MQDIAVLIPAAGASSRMRGCDKLLEKVDGLPLLRRQAKRAIFTGAHVVVTVPHHDHARAKALNGLPVQLISVPDAELGMSSSLRRGVSFLPDPVRALMILPGDMPDIGTRDILTVVDSYRACPFPALHQATSADGVPGHPVLFPSDCFSALQQLNGDKGARSIVEANKHRLRQVPLPGMHALTDLDTPEAWKAWRSEHMAAAQLPA